MRPEQLSSLDLNLLTLADVLLETRSVTQAAAIVHLSQPAVSRALSRLRDQLGDALLVRERRTMVLTPYAQRLRPRLRSALLQLERALAEVEPFDPKVAKGSLALATADFASVAFMPRAVERMQTEAPGLSIVVVPYVEPFESLLEADECDMVIGPRPSDKSWIVSEILFTTSWSCVARRGHSWLSDLSLDGFCEADHLMVSPTGQGPGPVDRVLKKHRRRRRVVARVPEFAGALALAAQSDLLLVVPTLLAKAAGQFAPLAPGKLPFELPETEIFFSWHAARRLEARAAWARGLVTEVVRSYPTRNPGESH